MKSVQYIPCSCGFVNASSKDTSYVHCKKDEDLRTRCSFVERIYTNRVYAIQ